MQHLCGIFSHHGHLIHTLTPEFLWETEATGGRLPGSHSQVVLP